MPYQHVPTYLHVPYQHVPYQYSSHSTVPTLAGVSVCSDGLCRWLQYQEDIWNNGHYR